MNDADVEYQVSTRCFEVLQVSECVIVGGSPP